MKLYLIKTICIIKDPDNLDEVWNHTTDAVVTDLQVAMTIIQNNAGDLSEEGYNKYAGILEIETGLYPIGEELAWYIWDKQEKRYVSCDRPEILYGYCLSI